MLAQAAAEFWAGARTSAGGAAPSGPPTSPALSFEPGSDLVDLDWTAGDGSAATDIGFSYLSGGSFPDPDSTLSTQPAGVTHFETGSTAHVIYTAAQASAGSGARAWFVRHSLNGQVTAWVIAGSTQ